MIREGSGQCPCTTTFPFIVSLLPFEDSLLSYLKWPTKKRCIFYSSFLVCSSGSLPNNISILQLPTTPSPASFKATTPNSLLNWPPTPYTFRHGPNAIVFQRYGRQLNSTLTKELLSATLNIQTTINHGAATFQGHSSIAMRCGNLAFNMLFSGQTEITKGDVFLMLDYWRVYVGAFGAREIVLGEIDVARPWTAGAASSIDFDRV